MADEKEIYGPAKPRDEAYADSEDEEWWSSIDPKSLPTKTEKEIEEMPLFMESLTKESMDNEGMHALQEMIYGEMSVTEQAEHFKSKGNELLVKGGKKRAADAAQFYTNGLAVNASDEALNASLYANRAQANLYLENYGKVVNDCVASIKLKPDNAKVYFRAAKAAFALGKFDMTIEFANKGLEVDGSNALLQKLLDETLIESEKKRAEDARAKAVLEAKAKKSKAMRLAMRKRDVVLLKAKSPAIQEHAKGIRLDEEMGLMFWPVLLLYQEHMSSDFIQEFCEQNSWADYMDQLFPAEGGQTPMEWDEENKYTGGRVDIYFERYDRSKRAPMGEGALTHWEKVDVDMPLGSVLEHPDFVIAGIPVFYAVVRGTPFEKEFLASRNESGIVQ